MNLSEANSFLPLIAAGLYALLLAISVVRRGHQVALMELTQLFIGISILWEFLIYFGPELRHLPDFSIKTQLVALVLLANISALYAGRPKQPRWLLIGLVLFVVSLVADLMLSAILDLSFLYAPLPKIRFSNLTSYGLWFGLGTYVLARTWRDFRQAPLPWHANRLLYWSLASSLILVGEALTMFRLTGMTSAGQILRALGVIGAAHAVASHRIFDVRTRSQGILAFLVVSVVSGAPLVLALVLLQWVLRDEPVANTVWPTIAVVTIGLLLYLPIRRWVERVAYRFVLGEGVSTSKTVREYSQAVYRTLDLHQLALVAIGTLGDLLGATRGALMLITENESSAQIEPIPVIGEIQRQKIDLPLTSPFLTTLQEQHQPLLQYDLDFNPEFATLSSELKAWLKALSVEVFVPISTGSEIVGVIALGPRGSGIPYQPGELELAQMLADQTVVALQNSRLYGELSAQNEKIRLLNVDLVGQNERLELMDRVKTDFITIASHELRTPLTQVKGYTDILTAMNEEEGLSQDQTRGILGHINRAALQLERLITDMLDASQIDVAGVKLVVGTTRLDDILRIAIEPLGQALRERRISFSANGVEELPSIDADARRLIQAFTNLIGNAVKYTPDYGSVCVEAALQPSQDGEATFIEIVIKDTGIGIDPRYHDLIFEKFFRVGDPQLHSTGSTKYKGGGPGLGLPIARGVIEAHGGAIWVESEGEDEMRFPGSQFHVLLPTHPLTAKRVPPSRQAAGITSLI